MNKDKLKTAVEALIAAQKAIMEMPTVQNLTNATLRQINQALAATNEPEEINEDVAYIKDFLKKMRTQDCRGTASPYFYVIRDFKKDFIPDSEGYGDTPEAYYFDEDGNGYDYEQYCKHLEEYEEPPISEEDFEGIDRIIMGYYREKPIICENTLFLTETDAEEHLKANHYHYSPKAHTYVMHAWRAPELHKFFKCLHALFGESGDE